MMEVEFLPIERMRSVLIDLTTEVMGLRMRVSELEDRVDKAGES